MHICSYKKYYLSLTHAYKLFSLSFLYFRAVTAPKCVKAVQVKQEGDGKGGDCQNILSSLKCYIMASLIYLCLYARFLAAVPARVCVLWMGAAKVSAVLGETW